MRRAKHFCVLLKEQVHRKKQCLRERERVMSVTCVWFGPCF